MRCPDFLFGDFDIRFVCKLCMKCPTLDKISQESFANSTCGPWVSNLFGWNARHCEEFVEAEIMFCKK